MKKKLIKKLFLLMAVVVTAMVCFAFSAGALDETGKCGKNVYWNYNSSTGELVISGTGNMYDYDYYDDIPFFDSSIKSLVVEKGVTSIGSFAFWDCRKLTSVTIFDSVMSIGDWAFHDCRKLANVTIPDSVISIGKEAFYNCNSLTNITIPNSVGSIGDFAFHSCDGLESIIIPNSVTSIGNSVFYSCNNLTSVTIPNSVTSIGDSAFSGCNLTNIIIPNSVTSIGDSAFSDCNLTSVTIPNSVTSIGAAAFSGCNLTSVTISNSVTSIGDGAFAYCNRLTSVTIPNSVTSIGDGAFAYCNRLTSVTIPNSVTSIGKEAFRACKSLTSITIPESVTRIGRYLFSGCRSLTNVTIPESVTSIGYNAFRACKSLTSITIPDSVTSIGKNAFNSCCSLANVTIGNSVTSIGFEAFNCCENLKFVFYAGSASEWSNIKIGSLNDCLKNATIHYNSTDHTVSDWITVKEATVYSAGKKETKCTVCGLKYETKILPQLKCSKPALKAVSNSKSGVKITWSKVKGGDYYRVYRKAGSGSWKYLDYTYDGYLIDKTAKSGTKYSYAVSAKNEAGVSARSGSLSIKRLSVPKLSTVSNASAGVKITWKKVTGASNYIVYRKTKGGKWDAIKKTSKLYYTDEKAKTGTTYYYTVRVCSGSDRSHYDTDGLSIKRLRAPKLSSATSSYEGILVKWNKITGASGYYVYRKASSGEWKKIATVKGESKIKYLDETPRKGATYQYRVKAYYGKAASVNSNAVKVKCKY